MFHYHRMRLLLNEVQHQHNVNLQKIKEICSSEAGPSIKTIEKMCYENGNNIFKSSYLNFIQSLTQYFAQDDTDYLNPELALKNFLLEANDDDLITIDKLTLYNILTFTDYRAEYYTNQNHLSYHEWLEAIEYNTSLLTKQNKFDFSPSNEHLLRQYFEGLNINLNFRSFNKNNIEVTVLKNKYSPFYFQFLLRSINYQNSRVLWCSEYFIEILNVGYILENLIEDFIILLEQYAIEQGFDELYFTSDFYNYGNTRELFYVNVLQNQLLQRNYSQEDGCRFYGERYNGYYLNLPK